ncbi:MAG: hypothetical protein DDT42_00840 [candidate division WS2 bacterium]|uniref:Uncharacterized protein n=1 Tax=Psychracetigena formicireducens TaxID=2986056 RepID=A0A9E2BH65_PSYF1|nr:hypothetical protein [Candidatus Psychracetigena formicireducens]
MKNRWWLPFLIVASLLLILISVYTLRSVISPQVSYTWQKTFGKVDYPGWVNWDEAHSIEQTTDGGYIVAGYTRSSIAHKPSDVYILRLDSKGDLLWEKTFGGKSSVNAYSIQQTTDGGYIVAGSTTSSSTGMADVYILRLDANGILLWEKTYGRLDWAETAYSIQQTTDGGYILVGCAEGRFEFPLDRDVDIYILKLNYMGDLFWEKIIGNIDSDEYAYSIQQTTDGGYIVAGSTTSSSTGMADVYILRLDANGILLWEKTYGRLDWAETAYSIQQTTDGGYVVAGSRMSHDSEEGKDTYILKLDSKGDLIWEKTFDFRWEDTLYSIQQTTDGGYIAAGYTLVLLGTPEMYILRLDSRGGLLWQRTFSGDGWSIARSIQQATDGGYVVAGYTAPLKGGPPDVHILKLNSRGETLQNRGTESGPNLNYTFYI